jgi:pimeloyl-ACP methyl ester carboxylesterase
VQAYFEPVLPAAEVRRCRAELDPVADLTQYTTSIAADDLDEVRAWLGYDKINLEGGSYGTRAAQVYLRRHGEHVRSALLVGVAGMDQYLPMFHLAAKFFERGTAEGLDTSCVATMTHPPFITDAAGFAALMKAARGD